jgi:carbonic anhydrase
MPYGLGPIPLAEARCFNFLLGGDMNRKITAALAIAGFAASASAQHQHWGYSGEGAPQNWGKLDPEFAACAKGKAQSPIDLGGVTKGDLKPLSFDYRKGAAEILNNGHTVQVNYQPGSTLTVNGQRFELKQFHFHAPSENTFKGHHFPLEGHLVHADKNGKLAVVAVMFSEGAANPLLTSLWKTMPSKEGQKTVLKDSHSALEMLPAERDYYQFTGSLTTPPCSEGVLWLVIRKPASASKAQVEAFSKTMGFANNRPVQALNARKVISR